MGSKWCRSPKKKTKSENGQIERPKMHKKEYRKNHSSDSGKEHDEPKFYYNDSNLDTRPGECLDDSDATCIFCEAIFSAGTREEECTFSVDVSVLNAGEFVGGAQKFKT